MPKKISPAPESPAPEAGAIVLVGQPGALKGELYLDNPGDARLVLRGAALSSAQVQAETGARKAGAARTALPESRIVAQKIPALTVRPGERRRVPLKFALAPETPPGEYHSHLQLADRSIPVVFHVVERLALEISPSQLVLRNEAGATIAKQVVLHNRGNVPLDIDELSAIPLDDELLNCRILRGVAAAVDGEAETNLDTVLAAFARHSRAALDQAGILRVRNRSGKLTLQPGEIRSITLEFRLPETLEKRSRYRALLPIYTADLVIVIAPGFDGQSAAK
jgi:hypothetical protein